MRRGDVYLADLTPRSGSEQQGTRPVILISRDAFNRVLSWQSVNVVPVSTSSAQARRGPTGILLPAGAGGLKKESSALCHQVTTLDRSKLLKYLGRLEAHQLQQVDAGLKAALQLR